MARATALTKGHANDSRAYYVDVAKYPHRPNMYAAAVIAADTGVLTTSGSIRCKLPTQAEEFAIALALAIPDCRTVLSDSKPAIVNFATNNVHGTTARVCSTIARPETNVTIKWFPAHAAELDAGPNRNEEADTETHALTSRGSLSTHSSEPQRPDAEDEEYSITTYGDVLQCYWKEGIAHYDSMSAFHVPCRKDVLCERDVSFRRALCAVLMAHSRGSNSL
ncbi:hypothetical protein MTO96_048828 [Rhipicephalus appendiculatus]